MIMKKNLTLKEILSLNSQVDEKLLKQARELLRKLRQAGVSKRGYNLVPPYSRRLKPISKESDIDLRTVRVGHSS